MTEASSELLSLFRALSITYTRVCEARTVIGKQTYLSGKFMEATMGWKQMPKLMVL